MRNVLLSAVAAGAVIAGYGSAWADEAAAQRWIEEEFQPSTLSKDEQKSEMQWFIDAAQPFSGMEINVLSEGIPTHGYESEVLTKAFEEITGIKVNHQILGEGEVVQVKERVLNLARTSDMVTILYGDCACCQGGDVCVNERARGDNLRATQRCPDMGQVSFA